MFVLAIAGTALQCRQPEKVNPTQTTIFDKQEIVLFNLKQGTDTTTVDNIEWAKEQLESEFELKGKNTLRYRIKLVNDSVGELWQYKSGTWDIQEQLTFTDWTVRRVDGNKLYSEFRLTDFNQDGTTDLTFLYSSNMNGNDWTKIFLNDGNKLVKLMDNAGDIGSDIWDRPEYDPKTGIINCTSDGSAYGTSSESTYKLNGLVAIPLTLHEQDRTEEIIKDSYFKGNNGKWQLEKTEPEKAPVK